MNIIQHIIYLSASGCFRKLPHPLRSSWVGQLCVLGPFQASINEMKYKGPWTCFIPLELDNWVYLLVFTWPFSGLNSWNEKQRPLGHVPPLSSSERLLREANVGRQLWNGPVGRFLKRSNKFLFFNITCWLLQQGPKDPTSFYLSMQNFASHSTPFLH